MRTQVHAGEDAFVNTRDAHPTALPPSRASAWRAGQGRQRARSRITTSALILSMPHSFGESERRAEGDRTFAGMPYELAPAEMHVRIVAEVQRQLGIRGYYRRRINGRYGRGTAFAVRTFQLRSGISPTGQLDMITLDALGLPAQNMAYLESAPSSYGSRVRVHKKFKQGKWKAKWKKHHQGGDGYAEEDGDGNGNRRRHGGGHGDDE
jgi:hypothetical protein